MTENSQLALITVLGAFLTGLLGVLGTGLSVLASRLSANSKQTSEIHAAVKAVSTDPTPAEEMAKALAALPPADLAAVRKVLMATPPVPPAA